MKIPRCIGTCILIIVTVGLAVGQTPRPVGINEVRLPTPRGDQPAFEFFIPETDAATVVNAWNRFHESFKVLPRQDTRQANYFFSNDASIPLLSENLIDVYARIYETGGGVRFACAFDLGGVFISSNMTPSKFELARRMLNRFYAEMALGSVIEELDSEKARMMLISSELDSIDAHVSKLEEDAGVYQADLDSTSAVIQFLAEQKELVQWEIEEIQLTLSELRSSAGQNATDTSAGLRQQIRKLQAVLEDLEARQTDIDQQVLANSRTVDGITDSIEALRSALGQAMRTREVLIQRKEEQDEKIAELEELVPAKQ